MPAANESQGLKIAVAAFVSLSVVLAVTTYFMFSNYQQASAEAKDANDKAALARKEADDAQRGSVTAREIMGYPKIEDMTALKAEYDKNQAKWKSDLEAMKTEIDELVKKAQGHGATDKDIANLHDQAVLAIEGVNNEANGTLRSKIDRLVEELRTQTQLLDSFVVDNIDLRTSLEGVNTANEAKLKVAEDARAKAEADLQDQQKKHEADRQTQLATLDQYQTLNRDQANKLASAEASLNRLKETYAHERTQLLAQVKDLRRQLQMAETPETLNPEEGNLLRVVYVDYTSMEVRVNATRAMGARPLMKFGVFDRSATGLISDKPKDTIQLISVGDTDSVARIMPRHVSQGIRQAAAVNPIQVNDIVYSPVFIPYQTTQIALIGKIDMNQDGRDDREDLKRMIRAAGGQVTFDLPPPGSGTESGELTAKTSGYVQDERRRSDRLAGTPNELTAEYKVFLGKQSDALEKAAQLGIPPIPIGRLLNSLGYGPGSLLPSPGHIEAIDRRASESVTAPGGVRGTLPVRSAPKPEEAPKEEEATPKEGAAPPD